MAKKKQLGATKNIRFVGWALSRIGSPGIYWDGFADSEVPFQFNCELDAITMRDLYSRFMGSRYEVVQPDPLITKTAIKG